MKSTLIHFAIMAAALESQSSDYNLERTQKRRGFEKTALSKKQTKTRAKNKKAKKAKKQNRR